MKDKPPDKKLSKREAAEIRLRSQYAKYLKATASQQDIKALLKAGMIDFEQAGNYDAQTADEPTNTPPEIVQGLTRLATWIQDVFKIPCSKQTIKNWQKELPPFPNAVSADYRYRWAEVAAWVQQHKVRPIAGGNNADLLAKLEPARAQEELERFEHNRMMRAVEAGKYLKKSDVVRVSQGIGKTINGILNNRLELRLRVAVIDRLNARPASPPLTTEQSALVVEVLCELGRETNTELKTELRTQLYQFDANNEAV